MKLSRAAHEEVESFLREYRGEPGLKLPRFSIHAGAGALAVMWFVRMGAITLGRHVFVSPPLVRRDSRGRFSLAGWLVVHEAVHVLQYEERGFAGFLFKYLLGYWRALGGERGWNAAARMAAYMEIAEEREARAAERAYVERRRAGDAHDSARRR
jgi:hypothetical protein